eukprot:jgi/Chrzof1/4010/Cz13g17040.t1
MVAFASHLTRVLYAGVDPKSIVCEFFRHGQCTKGFKCKFSHDLAVERKTAKIDLFTDQRDVADGDEEGMEDWDQETLEKVVKEKHGSEKPTNTTNIICKFFLDAVEKRQYGWFWKCPNGSDCKYRHALPPGYVLKSQMKELLAEEAAKNSRDMSEVIEEERQKVQAKTQITEEVFQQWRARKVAEKRKQSEEQELERRKKGLLNGREIFLQEGFTAQDDAGAAGEFVRDDDEERINEMFKQASAAQRAAREAEEQQPTSSEEAAAVAGSSSADASVAAAANGVSHLPSGSANGDEPGSSTTPATTLQLGADDEGLFDDDDDDDDDDDEEEEEEEDGGDDDDADSHGQLEDLQDRLNNTHVS